MPSVCVLRATSCLQPHCLWLCPWLALLLGLASRRYSFQQGDGCLSLVQGAYCVRRAPHATDQARPRLSVVSHRRQIRFSSCKQRIHFSAVVLAGRRSRPGKNTCRVPSLNRLLSSVLLRLRGPLPVCITTCRYCFVRSRARLRSRLIASKYASKIIILSSAM